MARFQGFLGAFPRNQVTSPVNADALANEISAAFEVEVPSILAEWWNEVGSGYFADREFFVFPDRTAGVGRSIVDWNSASCWRKILPAPKEGGPIFFAENCFGNQLGFRWHDGRAIGYLLDVDTFEAFTAAETLAHLFDDVLINRYALTDPRLLAGVRDLLGTVPDDTHYAPLVSPLVGGRLVPQNYQLETANVHLRTSIATWEATRG